MILIIVILILLVFFINNKEKFAIVDNISSVYNNIFVNNTTPINKITLQSNLIVNGTTKAPAFNSIIPITIGANSTYNLVLPRTGIYFITIKSTNNNDTSNIIIQQLIVTKSKDQINIVKNRRVRGCLRYINSQTDIYEENGWGYGKVNNNEINFSLQGCNNTSNIVPTLPILTSVGTGAAAKNTIVFTNNRNINCQLVYTLVSPL